MANSVHQANGPVVQTGRVDRMRITGGDHVPLVVIAVLVVVGAATLAWVVWLLGPDPAGQGVAEIGTPDPPNVECSDGGTRVALTAPSEITQPEYSTRFEVRCAPEPGHEYHVMIEFRPSPSSTSTTSSGTRS